MVAAASQPPNRQGGPLATSQSPQPGGPIPDDRDGNAGASRAALRSVWQLRRRGGEEILRVPLDLVPLEDWQKRQVFHGAKLLHTQAQAVHALSVVRDGVVRVPN